MKFIISIFLLLASCLSSLAAPVCDGVTDDTVAIQTVLAAALGTPVDQTAGTPTPDPLVP